MTEGSPSLLQPGEDIKPPMSKENAIDIIKQVFGLDGGTVTELVAYDDKNFHYINPTVNKNGHITKIWPHGYVLKVLNSLDSRNPTLTEGQNEMMLFLRKHHIRSTVPVRNLSGQYCSLEKLPWKKEESDQKEYVVRLLEYQPGKVLKKAPADYSLYFQAGMFVAKLDNVLKDFYHPVYDKHNSLWNLESADNILNFTFAVKDLQMRKMVEEIIDEFKKTVLSQKHVLEKGMIHGDFNEQNVLCEQNENGKWIVSAVLDFGDSAKSCYLYELAITMCYLIFECQENGLDYLVGSGYVLAGYKKVRSLTDLEHALLKVSICLRFCQSLVLGAYTYTLHPDNDYVFERQEIGWPLLAELWATPQSKLTQVWEDVERREIDVEN